jgi:uncharacterized membrane protein YtjA (UPF0391 family)
MFRSALGLGPVFLFLAVVAALFGFGTPSSGAGDVARVLFVAFLALAALSFAGVWVLHRRDTARREAAWLSYGRTKGRAR